MSSVLVSYRKLANTEEMLRLLITIALNHIKCYAIVENISIKIQGFRSINSVIKDYCLIISADKNQ